MKLIVAKNKLNHIGLNGGLPWTCKEDLRHFKRLTINDKLLVGSKTYESMPKLPNREIIVVGKNYLSLDEALAQEPDWLIGGATMYKELAYLCTEWHISEIRNCYTKGDTLLELPEPPKGCIIYHYYFNADNLE